MRKWRSSQFLKLLGTLIVVVLWTLVPRPSLGQEDIQTVKLRSIDGWVGAGLESEKELTRRSSRTGKSELEETEKSFFEELNLGGTISIYHPRFLLIDGHVLVRMEQGEREVSEELVPQGDEDEFLNEYSLNLSFLSEHPYNLTIFGNRYTSETDAEFFPAYEVTTENLGASLRWRNRFLPMSLSAVQTESQGGASNDIDIDENTRNVEYQVSQSKGWRRSNFEYEWEDREDRRSRYELTTNRASLTNTLSFGQEGRSRLNNYLNFRDQKGNLDRQEILGRMDLQLYHRPTFQTRYRYQGRMLYTKLEKTVDHDAEAGFEHRLYRNLTTNFDIGGYVEDSDTGFVYEPRTRLNFDYVRSIPYGSVSAGTNVGVRFRDENFITTEGQVLDEAHTFDDSNIVRLTNEFVRTSTIVVKDTSSLLTYTEGLDYRVQEVGTLTEIVRLIGGIIPAGGDVLVDFEFERPRDRRFTTIDRGVRFGLNLFQALRFYTSYYRVDRHLLKGLELGGEDDIDDWVAGVSFDRWGLHATAEHEEYDSEISPRLTDRLSASLSLRLPFRSSISGGATWSHTDYPNDSLRAAVEPDVRDFTEVVTYQARFTTNPFRNLFVEAGARMREEEGRAENDETAFYGRLNLRIRQIEISIMGERVNEEDRTGEQFEFTTERDRDRFEVEVIRRF